MPARKAVAKGTRATTSLNRSMKLADALILRADRQKRIEQLKQRMTRSAKVQEGEKPPEDPNSLIRELEQAAGELAALIQRINRTNSSTMLDSETISDAIARRDILRVRYAAYRELAAAAAVTQDRYSKSEVKFKSTVNVAAIQKTADDLAREHRELDAKIQEANWRTELKK